MKSANFFFYKMGGFALFVSWFSKCITLGTVFRMGYLDCLICFDNVDKQICFILPVCTFVDVW